MRRLLFSGIVAASFATACTAIIAGQVGDRGDRPVDGGPPSNSDLDTCSLRRGANGSPVEENSCSTCIENNCSADITYACNGGSYNKKAWFSDMEDCAQTPWPSGFAPQGMSTSSSWGCSKFKNPVAQPNDNGSDTEREEAAHNCITNKCLTGATPPCKLCDVHIKKSDNDAIEAELKDDACGSCVYDNCQEAIIACCEFTYSNLMYMLKRCAYTKDPDNAAACYELRKNDLDGGYPDSGSREGPPINTSQPEQVQCFNQLTTCFKNKCASSCVPK